MPRRKLKTMRTTPSRDIEAIRAVIADGVPWLDVDQRELTRQLTREQRALLAHLTPFKSAAKFISELDPDVIDSARRVLATEIATAKKRCAGCGGTRLKRSIRSQVR
jgi:hypothetical protein